KIELRSNDARNYKEDCHRLSGAEGAWIAYHAPHSIVAVRVWAFGDKQLPELEFYARDDANKRQKLESHTEDYYAGKEMYNFHRPRLYTLDALPDGKSNVTIQFTRDAQIGRVEIEYQ